MFCFQGATNYQSNSLSPSAHRKCTKRAPSPGGRQPGQNTNNSSGRAWSRDVQTKDPPPLVLQVRMEGRHVLTAVLPIRSAHKPWLRKLVTHAEVRCYELIQFIPLAVVTSTHATTPPYTHHAFLTTSRHAQRAKRTTVLISGDLGPQRSPLDLSHLSTN